MHKNPTPDCEQHSLGTRRVVGWCGWRLLAVACLATAGCATGKPAFAPQDGDLLFQDLDAGPLCDAIETVTQGTGGAKFSHVGIAVREGSQCAVIEAGGGGVKITPLEKFLARSHDAAGKPKVLVGRLKPEYREDIAPALARARALMGRPYDGDFLLDNGKYYCSELVYEAYLAPDGEHLFAVAPMTFCAPGTTEPMEVWKDYFARKAEPIPEGEPGCNPGGLSRSDRIEIVHAYGFPSGWKP